MDEKMLSVVVPAYNEEGNIAAVCGELTRVLDGAGIPFEIVLVDDGSRDGTWMGIFAESHKRPNVRGLHFSRNFGKEAAILAGLENAKGACCAVMDGDLQHPPETLVEMYRLWIEGYEVIEGIKSSRGLENWLHRWCAKTFYNLMSSSTKSSMADTSDFKLLDRCAVNAILSLPERDTFFRAFSAWVGFKSTTVTYDVQERRSGKSKWSRKALVKYAVHNITSFTSAPLQIVTILGILFFALAIVQGAEALVRYFLGDALGGFTTVILIELIIGSVVMVSLGIVGTYIGKIYDEVKDRPRYIISRTTDDNEHENR